jgi:putative RecB family exonuclease
VDRIRFGSVPVFGRQKRGIVTLRLSPHSIALFRQCKLQYKFRYIEKLGDKYGKARPYFTMANHVHAALHDLFSSVFPEERTVEVGRQLLMNNWRRYRVGFKDKGDERRWAQRALNEITRFIVEQDITSTPLMLETPIEAKITPGLILRGRVDRVDKEPDGCLHIIDYKTGVFPESIDWTQLELHSLALSRSTTYTVSKVSYLYLLSGTLESRQLDGKSLDKTTWELLRIAKEIRAEKSYPPNPGPACAGCDFAPICPARHEGYVKIGEVDLPLWRDFNDILLEE